MWECDWWRLYKTTTNVKQHVRELFSYRRSLTDYQLLDEKKNGKVFGYVRYDIEVPQKIPPIFKNTSVSKNNTKNLKTAYAQGMGIIFQPRKMMISSFTLQNGTLITPLLLFYLQLGLVATKLHLWFNKLQRNVSTVLYKHQWTRQEKVMRNQTPV